ncbi:MAG: hypothetical protein HRT89_02665 [Lentisphaeria bacterium]|nr:hypothetical protein [Lentisphaeria bacterium]NQZ66951.1 hypothetical protein [Lentisphaeria bacterium]
MDRTFVSYSKVWALNFDNRDEADLFSDQLTDELQVCAGQYFPESGPLRLNVGQAENGEYLIQATDTKIFMGELVLGVGWDIKSVDGKTEEYMGLNVQADGFSPRLKKAGDEIEETPNRWKINFGICSALVSVALNILLMQFQFDSGQDISMLFGICVGATFFGAWVGNGIGGEVAQRRYDKIRDALEENSEFQHDLDTWEAFVTDATNNIEQSAQDVQ